MEWVCSSIEFSPRNLPEPDRCRGRGMRRIADAHGSERTVVAGSGVNPCEAGQVRTRAPTILRRRSSYAARRSLIIGKWTSPATCSTSMLNWRLACRQPAREATRMGSHAARQAVVRTADDDWREIVGSRPRPASCPLGCCGVGAGCTSRVR